MRSTLRRLEAAGATCIAIPCNTAHHWHAALQAVTPVLILHIVDAVADALRDHGVEGGCIGVLATTGTVKAGIYQKRLARRGFSCRMPDAAGQAEVMRAIRLVKAGQLGEATAILRAQAEALVSAGCRRVVMACTEIPVALASVEGELRSTLIDATEALAQTAPSTWGGAWRGRSRRVGGRHDIRHQVTLCRLPLSRRGHQPRRLALLPLSAEPAHGRRDAGGPRHRREPRDRAPVGPQVRPGLRQPDPAPAALSWRQVAPRRSVPDDRRPEALVVAGRRPRVGGVCLGWSA